MVWSIAAAGVWAPFNFHVAPVASSICDDSVTLPAI